MVRSNIVGKGSVKLPVFKTLKAFYTYMSKLPEIKKFTRYQLLAIYSKLPKTELKKSTRKYGNRLQMLIWATKSAIFGFAPTVIGPDGQRHRVFGTSMNARLSKQQKKITDLHAYIRKLSGYMGIQKQIAAFKVKSVDQMLADFCLFVDTNNLHHKHRRIKAYLEIWISYYGNTKELRKRFRCFIPKNTPVMIGTDIIAKYYGDQPLKRVKRAPKSWAQRWVGKEGVYIG